MASRRKWIWIVVIFLGVCVIALMAVAGAGVYFVANHFDMKASSSTDAGRSFEEIKATFKEQKPLFEIDSFERAKAVRPIEDLPTSSVKPHNLWIQAWDPDEERLVKISLPFWLLRLGKRKVDFAHGGEGFDLDRLNIDVRELERIGPVIVIDVRSPRGERVLLWTQ
ncbi:MAG TPA: hypothetical protein VES67_22610 [Vicinamibacterales bacterium]|nr:hypothetical protein [Vicinamibacterales bacterium]